MNLKQLEAFVRIANNRSFSATAREMYLTQPTVSAAIKTLEEELGVALFIRTTRDISLTESGRKIYVYARQIVEAEKQIREFCDLEPVDVQMRQQIIISASTVPTQFILPELMAEFRTRHPSISFSVSESDSIGAVRDVQNHEADLGFCGTAPERKLCTYIPFYEDRLIVAAQNSEKYRKLKDEDIARWLPKESLIMRETGSGTRKEAVRKIKEMGIATEKLSVIASINNPEAIMKSVARGVGVTIISELAARDYIESGKVLAIPLNKGGSRWISMVYNSGYPQRDIVKKFIQFTKNYYRR